MALIWVIGLLVGQDQYRSVMAVAESSIHEVYAVARATMWLVGFYIAGRAAYYGLEFVVLAVVETERNRTDKGGDLCNSD